MNMKFWIFFIIMVAFLSNSWQAQAQSNLDSGLVAFYPFNGNADDHSGNNNHGIVKSAILTSDRCGNDSSAYEFDGTSTYITVPNSQTLQSPTTELTQLAWINIYSWSLIGTQFGPILMKSSSGTNAFQYRLSVGPDGVNTAINNWLNAVTTSDTLSFNEWYLIVSTIKDDTVKTYVNGVFIGEGTLTGPISPDSRPLELGRDVPGLIEIFHGKIDDVRIYDRALTDAEIQELFEMTTNLNKNQPKKLNQYQLSQNYPNPFNPTTTIKFDLPKTRNVTLKIFNILGEEVATLVSDRLTSGSHTYEWSRPAGMASGVYMYRLQAEEFVETRKMVLMR
jgi:hypothetical protein